MNQTITAEHEPEVIEGEIIDPGDSCLPVVSASALESLTRGEIDIQISTAHRYPRSLKQFKQKALTMATVDQETAGSCFFRLPRGGKVIEGPSIRLAEIVCSAWGNVRYGARVISIDAKFVTAQGFCHDLETNTAKTLEVKRRITDKKGRLFNEDMIAVTSNAACAIAARNALFGIIPMAYVREIYEKAKACAVGDLKTIGQRRGEMLAYFGRLGVHQEQVLATLGKLGVEDLDQEDLLTLRGFATAIKDGEATLDEVFPPQKTGEEGKGGPNAALLARLKDRGSAKPTNGKPSGDDAKKPEQAIQQEPKSTEPTKATPDKPAEPEAVKAPDQPAPEPAPQQLSDELQNLFDATATEMREAKTNRDIDAAVSRAMKSPHYQALGTERINKLQALRAECKAKIAPKKGREPVEEG